MHRKKFYLESDHNVVMQMIGFGPGGDIVSVCGCKITMREFLAMFDYAFTRSLSKRDIRLEYLKRLKAMKPVAVPKKKGMRPSIEKYLRSPITLSSIIGKQKTKKEAEDARKSNFS